MSASGYAGTVNFEIFRENFTFTSSVKRQNCHIKNLGLGLELFTSVNDRMILPFLVGLILTKLCICKLISCKNFRIYSIPSYTFIKELDEDKTWEIPD